MNTTIVIPTYAADAELCACAAKSVGRLRGVCPEDRIRLVIADDAAAPLDTLPAEADARLTTDFPRRGNLNGVGCVRGLLATYVAAALPDDDWVLKLDSDTYLCHLEWLRGRTVGCVYSGTGVGPKIFGSCYALTPKTAAAALELTQADDVAQRLAGAYAPEDLVISCLARMTGFGWERQAPRQGGAISQSANTFFHLDTRLLVEDTAEKLRHPFVSFKGYWRPNAEAHAVVRAAALQDLQAFAAFAADQPIPPAPIGALKKQEKERTR